MTISIIIPAYNEEGHIGPTVRRLLSGPDAAAITEIIVADGGSTDATVAEAKMAGAAVIISPKKGRSAQMNAGAAVAGGYVLYFLHADSIPPAGFTADIFSAIEAGYNSGCYRLRFDHPHWFLRANCWFTRFDIDAIRFGDQSLFVTRDIFEGAGGFCEAHIVMEDQEIIRRIRRHGGRFKVMQRAVTTSARKYLDNGVYRMQAIFFLIYFMYQLGYPQQRLVRTYRSLIKQDKV